MLTFCSYWVRNSGKHAWVETSPLDTSSWHHVVLVLKANNGEFIVYHDGESKVTQSLNINEGHSTESSNVIVGSETSVHQPLTSGVTPTGSPYASGSMSFDELTLWNRALSEGQVNQIFNMANWAREENIKILRTELRKVSIFCPLYFKIGPTCFMFHMCPFQTKLVWHRHHMGCNFEHLAFDL